MLVSPSPQCPQRVQNREDIHMSSWQGFYCAAVLETNPETLISLIREAETALFIRELELPVGLDGRSERLEIEHAASALRILTSESKGWVRTRTGLAISPAGSGFRHLGAFPQRPASA